jgi:hypothetical protein
MGRIRGQIQICKKTYRLAIKGLCSNIFKSGQAASGHRLLGLSDLIDATNRGIDAAKDYPGFRIDDDGLTLLN